MSYPYGKKGAGNLHRVPVGGSGVAPGALRKDAHHGRGLALLRDYPHEVQHRAPRVRDRRINASPVVLPVRLAGGQLVDTQRSQRPTRQFELVAKHSDGDDEARMRAETHGKADVDRRGRRRHRRTVREQGDRTAKAHTTPHHRHGQANQQQPASQGGHTRWHAHAGKQVRDRIEGRGGKG